MIRSVRIHEFGGPEVLRIEKIEVEEPGEGEVRMRIRGIGINRTEITFGPFARETAASREARL